MVEITGNGWNLIDGLAKVGFGTNDVTVRRVWVTGPNRMLANVSISPLAGVGGATVTVSNGLQMLAQQSAFSVQAANPRQLAVSSQVVNAATGALQLTPGTPAIAFASNLPAGITPAGVTVTLNDQPVTVQSVANGQVAFAIPATLGPGPVVLRVRTATDTALPVVINIDPPPPSVLAVQSAGLALDASRTVRASDPVVVVANGLIPDAFTGAINGLDVAVAGTSQTVTSVTPSASTRGAYEITFVLGTVTTGSQPLIVTQDGRSSAAFAIAVR
jgi:uncharacterized protein (TIGR03437 family)